MSDQIRRNGVMCDGAITIKVKGVEYYGWTDISYDDGLEVKKLWGLSSKVRGPRGRTAGKYDASDAVLKGPRSTVEELFTALLPLGQVIAGERRVSLVEFPITVTYADSGSSYTDLLKRCRLIKRKSGVPTADSADGVLEELTISVMSIEWNGKRL